MRARAQQYNNKWLACRCDLLQNSIVVEQCICTAHAPSNTSVHAQTIATLIFEQYNCTYNARAWYFLTLHTSRARPDWRTQQSVREKCVCVYLIQMNQQHINVTARKWKTKNECIFVRIYFKWLYKFAALTYSRNKFYCYKKLARWVNSPRAHIKYIESVKCARGKCRYSYRLTTCTRRKHFISVFASWSAIFLKSKSFIENLFLNTKINQEIKFCCSPQRTKPRRN